MKILITILFLFSLTYAVNRPYNGWRITAEYCYNESCERLPSVFIEAKTFTEAVKKFQNEYPDHTIRCIAEDYYTVCNWRW